MKRKPKSTYEELSENKKQKRLLNREYRDLLISELLLAAMEEGHISVRKLAAEAEVSPTIIQSLKSGKKTNITIETLSRILDVLDYQIILAPKKGCSEKQLRMA
jgi:DNA-binding Xre family transcriptional regulator